MTSKVTNRLNEIGFQLSESTRWYRILSNYCRCLNHDLFMINSSLEDECSTIGRIQVDSWLCEIEKQQNVNSRLTAINTKLAMMSAAGCIDGTVNQHIGQLAELDASIRDGYLQGKANRPVNGLIPCEIPNEIESEINDIEVYSLQTSRNWMEWGTRLTKHLNLVNKLATLFPASHSFASIPCSVSILLNGVLKSVKEQSRLENTLEILTASDEKDSYSAIFGLDILLIMDRLCPIPLVGVDE